jgi:hypothetical protein
MVWALVVRNSTNFSMFAFSFFTPANARDWVTFGLRSAFIALPTVCREARPNAVKHINTTPIEMRGSHIAVTGT